MVKIPATKAREELAELASRVCFGGERVMLTRHRKPLAVLISVEDLKVLEMVENRIDVQAAKAALAESGERISFDEVCERLGI